MKKIPEFSATDQLLKIHYRLLLIDDLSEDFSIVGDYRNNTYIDTGKL